MIWSGDRSRYLRRLILGQYPISVPLLILTSVSKNLAHKLNVLTTSNRLCLPSLLLTSRYLSV